MPTFKEALPRTVAPVTAAMGAETGFSAGCLLAGLMGTFAMDDPKASKSLIYAVMATIVGFSTLIGTMTGYGVGYGGSNLLMTAFPGLQSVQSRLLLSSGRLKQIGLFAAILALPHAGACVDALTNSNAPKIKKGS